MINYLIIYLKISCFDIDMTDVHRVLDEFLTKSPMYVDDLIYPNKVPQHCHCKESTWFIILPPMHVTLTQQKKTNECTYRTRN